MSFLGMLLVRYAYGLQASDLTSIIAAPEVNLRDAWVLRILNFAGAAGGFIAAAFLFSRIIRASFWQQSGIAFPVFKTEVPLLLALALLIFPSSLVLEQLNRILLPGGNSSIAEMIRKTDEARKLTEASILFSPDIFQLIWVLFFVAVMPAIAEEIFFRGILQRFLYSATGNIRAAILVQGLVFTLFHASYSGFLPIFFFGIIFGYITWKTGSIRHSILLHAANNAIAVLTIRFLSTTEIPDLWIWISGPVCVAAMVYLLYRFPKRENAYSAFYPVIVNTEESDNNE